MADSETTCAYCGKQGTGFKRCSACKQVSYCGGECQKAGWKKHKKTCEKPKAYAPPLPPVPLREVLEQVKTAHLAADWLGVLKWEGRMEELMHNQRDATCEFVNPHP